MGFKDAAGTLLVIAEARGRAVLAGFLDAAGDLAQVLVVLFGAGQIIEHGLDGQSVAVLVVICITSFCGTIIWTKVGTRLMPDR
jgi:hypothetical protein